MIEELRPTFVCEHCRKRSVLKHVIAHHEKFCVKDPKNWPKCGDCKHLVHEEETIVYDRDEYGVTDQKSYQAFSCRQRQCGLYPLKAARKKLPTRYPDTFKGQILMPNECEFFEEKGFVDPFEEHDRVEAEGK